MEWIKDLNARPKNSRRKQRGKLLEIGLGDDFLRMTQKAQATNLKMNKWGDMRLKSFCTEKKNPKTINKMEMQPIEWEKLFANHIYM